MTTEKLQKGSVEIALEISEQLERLDAKTRTSVLNILWFYYVGRYVDWSWRMRR